MALVGKKVFEFQVCWRNRLMSNYNLMMLWYRYRLPALSSPTRPLLSMKFDLITRNILGLWFLASGWRGETCVRRVARFLSCRRSRKFTSWRGPRWALSMFPWKKGREKLIFHRHLASDRRNLIQSKLWKEAKSFISWNMLIINLGGNRRGRTR